MIEKPYEGRAKIEQNGFEYKITIPSKRNWLVMAILSAWISIWTISIAQALNTFHSINSIEFDFFNMIWLAGWAAGGAFAIFTILWTLFGNETIRIENGILVKEKSIHTLKIYKKSYEISVIRHLKINQESMLENDLFGEKINLGHFLTVTGGKIRFDYGMRKVRFGIGLNEVEASFLIDEMVKKGNFVR